MREFLDSGRREGGIRWTWPILGALMMLGIACLDCWAGPHLRLSLLQVLPVALVAWRHGWVLGVVAAFAAAACCYQVDVLTHVSTPSFLHLLWRSLDRALGFLIVPVAVGVLDYQHQRLRALARHDPTTGLVNRPAFMELAARDLARAKRIEMAVSVALIDLENLKRVDDVEGHARCDAILKEVAGILRSVRPTDVVARLSFDEFAILFPWTDAAECQLIMGRLTAAVRARVAADHWALDLSVGVATATGPGELSLDDLLHEAGVAGVKRREKLKQLKMA